MIADIRIRFSSPEELSVDQTKTLTTMASVRFGPVGDGKTYEFVSVEAGTSVLGIMIDVVDYITTQNPEVIFLSIEGRHNEAATQFATQFGRRP